FSPDGTKLYAVRLIPTVPISQELVQYDLEAGAGTPIDILNSAVIINQYNNSGIVFNDVYNRLQVGPNGKIYVVSEDSAATLGVINRPNLKGRACRFIPYSFQTNLDTSLYGYSNLPTF